MSRLLVLSWWLILISFSLFVGLRSEIGADWSAYLQIFSDIQSLSFWDSLTIGDPGYSALNWSIGQLGGNIYFLNVICAFIVISGIVSFARHQPWPEMAFLSAVPYLITVVAMGYTRQSVAIGCFLLMLTSLQNNKPGRALFWWITAILFHKTAIVLVIVWLLTAVRMAWKSAYLILSFSAFFCFLFLFQESIGAKIDPYIVDQMESSGAGIRLLVLLVVGGILFLKRKTLFANDENRRIWLLFSLTPFICLPFWGLFSTFIDRMLLYIYPIILVFWGRLPLLFRFARSQLIATFLNVVVQAGLLFGWLCFANYRDFWVPYKMAFF